MTGQSKAYESTVSDLTALEPPQGVLSVMTQLDAAGFEAFAVGGCVRDALLGRKPHDWDLTTNATPDQMKAAVGLRSFDTGLKHGTVTFVADGNPVEVTTYRVDGAYSDGRRPDSITFTARLEDDLARRDFTVNAMAWSPDRGLVDPFRGTRDLREGTLRCVGDANRRFSEDGLRIMRALRFAAVHRFRIEDATARALHERVQMLDAVSRERISAELLLIMAAPDGQHLGNLVKEFADVLMQVMPELLPAYGLDQQNPHHDRDCFTHMVDAMADVRPDPALRLAALLHDIGKPSMQTFDEQGVAHYKGHAEAGARIVEPLLRRLKFPRRTVEEVTFLVRYHDSWPAATMRSARRFLARCRNEQRARDLLELMKADRSAHAAGSVTGRLANLEEFETLMNAALREMTAFTVRDLAIGGSDLIALGWQPGPALGAELHRLFDLVITGDAANTREDLLAAARR